MKSLDCLHYLVGMFIRLHLMPDLAHNAIFIDQERLTVDAYVLLSIQVLLSINTVELRNGCLCIGEQGKGQAVLFREFLMRVHTIGTDTKYHNTAFLHLMIGVTEAASLFRTAWCIVLRYLIFVQISDSERKGRTCQKHEEGSYLLEEKLFHHEEEPDHERVYHRN